MIVTVLTHQVEAVLPALGRSAARSIQFMFNTFDPERLRAAVGGERAAFGMPFIQATLDRDGRLKARIGASGQKTLMSDQRWVDVFNAAGLPAVRERDMPLWLRCHVPLCVAFESVSVAGVRRGGGASWREARSLARGVRASYRLIEAMGHTVYPRAKRLIYLASQPRCRFRPQGSGSGQRGTGNCRRALPLTRVPGGKLYRLSGPLRGSAHRVLAQAA